MAVMQGGSPRGGDPKKAVGPAPTPRPSSDLLLQPDLHLKLRGGLGTGASARVVAGELVPSGAAVGTPAAVAVKLLHRELLQDPEQVALFVQEVELLSALSHSNIVKYVACSWGHAKDDSARPSAGLAPAAAKCSPAHMYYVQEYCGGGSLGDLVRRQMIKPYKPLYSDAAALRWSLQIASALQYLHGHQPAVMHRDLKLDNVVLSSARLAHADAKLADFGLARRRPPLRGAKEPPPPRAAPVCAAAPAAVAPGGAGGGPMLTGRTGSFGYMAPEVLASRHYDASADIFSLGMVMHNLFARCVPGFEFMLHHPVGASEDPMELFAAKVAEGYRPAIPPGVAPAVAHVIEACWKGDASLRPSASQVVQLLERIQASGELGGTDADTPVQGCNCAIM